MQYVFFNNDSRFYKINVFKFTKGYFYTRDLRDSMCLVVRSKFAKVTPPPPPHFRRLWEAFTYFCSLHVDINYLFVQVIPN